MLVEIGQYKLDIDIAKTKRFYDSADRVSQYCTCDGCLNFEKAVDFLSPAVRTLFAELGVDMKKVRECYVNCTNNDGTLLYGGFYHICGVLLSGQGGWVKKDDDHAYWDSNSTIRTYPNFEISFNKEYDLLEKDFPLPVIQLDFSANIPWVLKKRNPYR